MIGLSEPLQILITAGVGSAVGTLVKALIRPEPHFGRWLAQLLSSFLIGALVGSAVIEWMQLTTFVGCMAAAASALISEEIVRGLQARGRKVGKGNFDLSAGGDSDER